MLILLCWKIWGVGRGKYIFSFSVRGTHFNSFSWNQNLLNPFQCHLKFELPLFLQLKNPFTNELCDLITLSFNFRFFFVKMKQYTTTISSVIFSYDTHSFVCEVFFSQARMSSCSSITPRRKHHLSVHFHKGFLKEPLVRALACSKRQVKQSHMLGIISAEHGRARTWAEGKESPDEALEEIFYNEWFLTV